MLSFLISTVTFSVAAYGFNRFLDSQGIDSTRSRTIIVMLLATFVSIGADWSIAEFSGDAEGRQKNAAMSEALHNGDSVQILKMLAGF